MFVFSKYTVVHLTKKLSNNFDVPKVQEEVPIFQGHHMALKHMIGWFSGSQYCHIPSIYICFLFPPPPFLLAKSAGKMACFKKSFCLFYSSYLLQLFALMWASHEGHKRTSQRHRHNWEQAHCVWNCMTSKEAKLQMSWESLGRKFSQLDGLFKCTDNLLFHVNRDGVFFLPVFPSTNALGTKYF